MANKHYVFWRATRDGTPGKRSDGKGAPRALLEELGRTANVDAQGRISWAVSGIVSMLSLESALHPYFVIQDPQGTELNESDTRRLVRAGIKSTIGLQGSGRPLAPEDVLDAVDHEAAAFFRSPPETYVAVTSLSIREFPSRRILLDGCELSPLRKRGNRYPYPVSFAPEPGSCYSEHAKSSRYLAVRIKTAGRSHADAMNRALNALNLLRGLWTIIASWGSWQVRGGIRRCSSMARIHVGPVHTLHKQDGTLVDDCYWYEHDYVGDCDLFAPKSGWANVENRRRSLWRRLVSLPYAEDMKGLIVRYAVALNNANLDIAFLQMWSLLERITDTVGLGHDKTVARASWLYDGRCVARESLDAVRMRRNQYVHSARSSEDRDHVVQLIKSFVEPHISLLIHNEFRIDRLSDYGRFLDFPREIGQLKKRRRELNRVLELFEKGEARCARN